MKRNLLLLVVLAAVIAALSAASASADYGQGAIYQIELSVNDSGPHGGGIWLWITLNSDNTGDYAGSDCGHGEGAASDRGDVTWHYDGNNVVIEGVLLNGLPVSIDPFIPPPYPTTITVPRTYGHYRGNNHAFLTLPSFLPVGGFSQLQVAP
jgi:hypothetical protein